ncbi:MAG: sulfatase-like hydrolase/transferase [Myxococcales bacterium]|nr:sulfatase-like hydrolase/transferase [Myxococcales bacterium]
MTAPRLRRRLLDDVRRGAAVAGAGLAAAALVEAVVTWNQFRGSIGVIMTARLLALSATLCALAWLIVGPLAGVAAALPRLWSAIRDGRAVAGARPTPGQAPSRWSPEAVAGLLTGGLALVGFVAATTHLGARFIRSYKEPTLTALITAIAAVVVAVVARGLARAVALLVVRVARRWPRVARWTPLGSAWLAAAAVVTVAAIALVVAGKLHHHLRPVWPWRKAITALAFVAGAGLQREWAARRVARAPSSRTALALAAAALVLVPLTLTRIGAAPQVKAIVSSSSPSLEALVRLVRRANDLDGDGFGSLLGENDCGPRDRAIHPGARDLPDNGVDENCDGRDFSMRDLAVPTGPERPVPPAFQKPYNVVLITIDTVRYDFTSFGHRPGGRTRDVTPNLAKLAERSTDFTFAQAPSAGTMASVPAIITSKFFHSGIALDETNIKPGMPPRLKPENLTLPEIMKQGGYQTGAILTHEYFNDWGLQQGVDEYDNEIGKTHDANRVSSDRVTDRALAWIARRPASKWFLWLHYLDPHAQYVAHPDDTNWSGSPEDLYEAELHYTDKHIGRLLDELRRMPGGDRTIVVVTSDHGDAFGEHGFSGHAIALTREILHVPMLVYVPDNLPRKLGKVVSNLDVLPTIAALCGIDVAGASFEGRSLVPQIFYGQEDPDRTVFAETNYPVPLRAAVTTTRKLIFNMKSNFYELYDLVGDPLEQKNLAGSRPEDLAIMRERLDLWLERVVFSRDPVMSQAAARMQKVLLPARPTPTVPLTGRAFDGGKVEVLGYDFTPAGPGGKATLAVYLHAVERPSKVFRIGAALWAAPTGLVGDDAALTVAMAPLQVRVGARVTLDGLLPSDRWRAGEYLREEFQLAMPPTWTAGDVLLGLVVGTNDGSRPEFLGPQPSSDPSCLSLGPARIPVPTPPPPPPTPATPTIPPGSLGPVAPRL